MTTLIDRPAVTPQSYSASDLGIRPGVVISAGPGQYEVMDVAQAYFALGERPIPLCDSKHAFVSPKHTDGYQRKDGTVVAPCKSPGKAPLVRKFPRFAKAAPTAMDIVRMFGSHQGNIGGVVPDGRIVIDIDSRSGGLESMLALTERYGPLPDTPTVQTGGNGLHYYFQLPEDFPVPAGGSFSASGYPGVEWKGPGAQVVLPPSVHESGRAYLWEPGYSLGDVSIAPIPGWLLQLILDQQDTSGSRSPGSTRSGSVKYSVQPIAVQEHFAGLWHQVGVEVQPGSGDQFYSCPFHQEQHPSLHVDAQRCIWFCFSPDCQGYGGGGVRLLEAMAGPRERGPLPSGLVFHAPSEGAGGDAEVASELGGNSYPNPDAGDPLLEELRARSKELFQLPPGQQPKVISRLCAFEQDPSRLIRHQVISNTWTNPVNRALKRRQIWVHLMNLFAVAEVEVLYGISISAEAWDSRKREALAAQVQRRGGQYAAFDDRAAAGHVRFLTDVPIPDAMPMEDIDVALFEALRDVDLPEGSEQQQRVHLVWLSQGWSLPAHDSKGTVKTIAYKRDVDPVNDAQEEEKARQLGLETWQGTESGDPEQWGSSRYFAVPQERVSEIGPERALDELLVLAQHLGYQPIRDVRSHFFPPKSALANAA